MSRTFASLAFLSMLAIGVAGCRESVPTAPVSGVVSIDGKPLEFGYVIFQPNKGPAAQGEITPGGAFKLVSGEVGDGAVLGSHRVSVYCYEGHRPGSKNEQFGHVSLGRSLIPEYYTRGGMSGLTAEVPPEGLADFKIELSSKGPGR